MFLNSIPTPKTNTYLNKNLAVDCNNMATKNSSNTETSMDIDISMLDWGPQLSNNHHTDAGIEDLYSDVVTSEVSKSLNSNPPMSTILSNNLCATQIDKITNNTDFFTASDQIIVKNFVSLKKKIVATGGLMSRFKSNEAALQGSREQFESLRRQYDLVNTDCQKRILENTTLTKEFNDLQQRHIIMENKYLQLKTDSEASEALLQQQKVLLEEFNEFFNQIKKDCPLKREDPKAYAKMIVKLKEDNANMKKTIKELNTKKPKPQLTSNSKNTNFSKKMLNNEREQMKLLKHVVRFGTLAEQYNSLPKKESEILKKYKRILRNKSDSASESDVEEVKMPSSCSSADTGFGSSHCSEDEKCIQSPEYPPNGASLHIPVYPEPRIQIISNNYNQEDHSLFENNKNIHKSVPVTEKRDIATSPLKINVKHSSVSTETDSPSAQNFNTEEEVENIFKTMKFGFQTISPFPATPTNLPKTPKSLTKRLKKRPRKNLVFSRLMSYLHTVVSQCQNERKWLIRQRKRESKFCRPIIQKIVASGLPKSATCKVVTDDTTLPKDVMPKASTIESKKYHNANPTKVATVSDVGCRLEPQAPQFDVALGADHEVEEQAKTSSTGAKTKQKLKGLALLRHKIRPKYKIKMDLKESRKNKDMKVLKKLTDVSSTEKNNKEAYLNAVKVMAQVNSKIKNNKCVLMRCGSKFVSVDKNSASEANIWTNNETLSEICDSQEIVVTNNDLPGSLTGSPVPKRKRGRPRKEQTAVETNEAVQATHKKMPNRKRGRTRKGEMVNNVKNVQNVMETSTLQDSTFEDGSDITISTIIKRKSGTARKEEKNNIEIRETSRVLRSHISPEQKLDKFGILKESRQNRKNRLVTSAGNSSNVDTIAPRITRNSSKKNKLAIESDLHSSNYTPQDIDLSKEDIESSSYINQKCASGSKQEAIEINNFSKNCGTSSKRKSSKIVSENSDKALQNFNKDPKLFGVENELIHVNDLIQVNDLIHVSDLVTDFETKYSDETHETLNHDKLINKLQGKRLSVELTRLSIDDIRRLSHEHEMKRVKISNQEQCAKRILRSSKSNSGSEQIYGDSNSIIDKEIKAYNSCSQLSQNISPRSNQTKGECPRESQGYSITIDSSKKHVLSPSTTNLTTVGENKGSRRITRLSANNREGNSSRKTENKIEIQGEEFPNIENHGYRRNASKISEKHMTSEKDHASENNEITSKTILARSNSNTSNDHCRLTSYDDLDLFNTDSVPQSSHIPQLQDIAQIKKVTTVQHDTSKFSETFFGSKLLKYGVMKKKYHIHKSPDEIASEVLSIAEKLEEEINVILNTPPARQALRMRQMVEMLKSINCHDLVRAIVEYFMKKSRTNDVLCLLYTPPAPPMMKSEQIFLFVLFELKVISPTIVDELLDSIEYKILRLNCSPEFEQVESLSHWFAVLCRATNKLNRLRMFVADSLYCLSFKAAVLANQVIDVWRDVLPAKKDRLSNTPLLYTIAYVLVHFPNEMARPDPKVQQLKQKLWKLYGYVPEDMCQSQVLEIYRRWILDLRENLTDKKNLRMAFTILCKRNGVDWCQKHVVSGLLMPIIHNHSASETAQTFCVSLLGYLMRPYPDNMRMHCELALNQLFQMFDNNPCAAMQEALLTTMLLLKRHGAQRLLAALVAWRPKREPSSELETLVRHYVRDKPLRVWLNSIKNI